jgi:hypothetical protein
MGGSQWGTYVSGPSWLNWFVWNGGTKAVKREHSVIFAEQQRIPEDFTYGGKELRKLSPVSNVSSEIFLGELRGSYAVNFMEALNPRPRRQVLDGSEGHGRHL